MFNIQLCPFDSFEHVLTLQAFYMCKHVIKAQSNYNYVLGLVQSSTMWTGFRVFQNCLYMSFFPIIHIKLGLFCGTKYVWWKKWFKFKIVYVRKKMKRWYNKHFAWIHFNMHNGVMTLALGLWSRLKHDKGTSWMTIPIFDHIPTIMWEWVLVFSSNLS